MEQTTLQEEKRDYAVLVGLRSPVLGDDSADEESLAELSAWWTPPEARPWA